MLTVVPLGVVHSTWGMGVPSMMQENRTEEFSLTTLFDGAVVMRG